MFLNRRRVMGSIGLPADSKLSIAGPSVLNAESTTYKAICNSNVLSKGTWSIISGSQYGTISNTGLLTLNSTANESEIIIQCAYRGLTDQKTITATYVSGTSSQTTTETSVDPTTGQTIEIVTTVITDSSGNTTTNITELVQNQDGSSTTIITDITESQDGSGTLNSIITNYDELGDLESYTTQTRITNSDTSYTGTSISYNEDGDPTDKINIAGDTSGNVNTQNIVYDENGNEIVTRYNIDTSNNPNGTKNYNQDGVDTEYYAFDLTHGFILDFDFVIDFTNQPAGQSENHHNILTMKRDNPSPWYGFQLRQSSTNKYVQLGTQFSTGSNVNTQLTPSVSISTNIKEYNLQIVYDPNASTNRFVCTDMTSGNILYQNNGVFPDIEELKYLTVTIGYSTQADGTHYRYSNIDVKNFNIRRIPLVATPAIACDGENITLTCGTVGAEIYYRLNQLGTYRLYTESIPILSDTLVEAYAELNRERSGTAIETCYYDNGISRPTISCDGEIVTIDCATPSVDIYYRLDRTGNFTIYTDAIPISADTVVEAYAELNGERSVTVTENCTYSPIVLDNPVILCSGDTITISCATVGANIYYKLNQTGNYALYTAPISILTDTFVEAYSQLSGHVSSVVSEACIYNPVHHYENDYLTFRIKTTGRLYWRANGSLTRDIQYSLNDGAWTTITSAATPPTITVAVGDLVRFKGTNQSYATSKTAYSGFGQGEAGTSGQATYDNDAPELDIEGNIMSLIYGDNFTEQTTFNGGTYNFCSMFKKLKVISAEHLILPALSLTQYCYRAMFSWDTYLEKAPALPATTLVKGVYWYMFESTAITTAPELPATTLVAECYGSMFINCSSLNYITCMATSGFTTSNCKQNWVQGVASSGTFVKSADVTTTTWTRGNSGIPTNWLVYDDVPIMSPEITYDGFDTITISCATQGAVIYYRLSVEDTYAVYSTPITITADALVEAYAEFGGQTSHTVSKPCDYVSNVPIEASNRDLKTWSYSGSTITTPYSINAIDGHSSSYAKGTFNFETSFSLRQAQPAYLWFQHADQSASVYVDDTLVEKHWGGYTAFFVDISNYVHTGSNNVKVAIKNNEGNSLAPAAGDFNFNATLGNVRLLTSDVLPATKYGYDGFHVTSNVTSSSATVYVKTSVPTGASVVCTIDDGTYHWTDTQVSDGSEMTFTTIITNPHLWNGTADPHLYNITLEIYKNNELYHRFTRPYGLRYYEYAIGNDYTGFLLNGQPYLLRGVCMHHDIAGKANALTQTDIDGDFALIQELGCNFIRLAHYPHVKEVYDWCDRLGIVVQTEAPCVNKLQSTMPEDYYTHLTGQYTDMVNQHYNHPCIMFWGLSNETTTDDKQFGNTKINEYTTLIKSLDTERMVGYVMSHNYDDPSGYYNNPNCDWFGCNIYTGWYIDQNSNNPSSRLSTRVTKTVTNRHKALAYSEYGCGGTQHCHSDDPLTTTTRGNHERHDIEYMMWLHEGQIAAIKQYPQLMFTAQWQLFDIAVSNRNEGYTVCLDGQTTSTDDSLRRLNNKGLVERDHITKKDPFYLYKAWWNPTPFIHICGKDYTKRADRVIKCYTNLDTAVSLYVNDTLVETVTPSDYIAQFTATTFNANDIIKVSNGTIEDSFTI